MGNFYTSLTVRGASHDDIVKATKGGKEIASRLACLVLAVLINNSLVLTFALCVPCIGNTTAVQIRGLTTGRFRGCRRG